MEPAVLRDDGDDADLGYPCTLVRQDGKIIVVYLFNARDGPERFIAASTPDSTNLTSSLNPFSHPSDWHAWEIQTQVAHVLRLCDNIASARGLIGEHVVLGFVEGEVAATRNRNEKEIHMQYFVRTALAVGLRELSSRI